MKEKINKNKGNSNEFSEWLQLEIKLFAELLQEIKRYVFLEFFYTNYHFITEK